MTAEERRSILEQLGQAGPALQHELDGISETQADWRPEHGRWSILDCVEHVAVTEALMFDLIANRFTPAEAVSAGREDRFLFHSTNRARKFTAPEAMHPRSRYASLSAALEGFLEQRKQTMQYVETCDSDLRDRKTMHPVAGEITCRECLALLIGHPMRHLQQIREVKSELANLA